MTVVRLEGGELLVHSPAELTPALRAELDRLGDVRFVLPASALHGHLFMEQYAAAYPGAELFAAPGLARRRRDLDFAAELGDDPDPRWAGELGQLVLRGHRFMPEVLLHHHRSRTLIVGDAVWNVTESTPLPARLWAGWRRGVHPTPAFRRGLRDRAAARASLERVLEWDFDRILIGHGEIVESGGRAAVRRAYRRVLEG